MLYVVHIAVDNTRLAEWKAWMYDAHVDDVLATGCFERAIALRVPDADTGSRTAFRIEYLARSAADLERYQREFAPPLQHDHTSRFEGAFSARRELLPVEKRFLPPS